MAWPERLGNFLDDYEESLVNRESYLLKAEAIFRTGSYLLAGTEKDTPFKSLLEQN
jgi:hypothetical protein